MMKNVSSILCIGLLILMVIPYAQQSTPVQDIQEDQDLPKIVASLNFIGDFVEALYGGSENVEVTKMISANQDPHFFEPGTTELTAMSEADIILALGSPEFDEWLTDYIADSGDTNLQKKIRNIANTSAMERIDPITNTANPHFWLDPSNAKVLVNNTAEILLDHSLITEVTLQTTLPVYHNKLDELNAVIDEMYDEYKGTKVVVDHPSFFYLLDRIGIDRVGAIEEKEGEEPSPSHIQELTNTMREQNISQIVASRTQAGDDVEELARAVDAKISYLTPLPGIAGAENYTEMIRYNLDALVNPIPPQSQQNLLAHQWISYIIPLMLISTITIFIRKTSQY